LTMLTIPVLQLFVIFICCHFSNISADNWKCVYVGGHTNHHTNEKLWFLESRRWESWTWFISSCLCIYVDVADFMWLTLC
jgi:hypothetical protein